MKAILIDGVQIGGAERRALTLYSALRARDYPIRLLVSGRFKCQASNFLGIPEEDMVEYDDYGYFIEFLLKAESILNRFRKRLKVGGKSGFLSRAVQPLRDRHLTRKVSEQEISTIHIFLDPEVGKNLPCKTLIEVTSPDYLQQLRISGITSSKKSVFHAVSETVRDLAKKDISEDRIAVAPITFFDIDRFPAPIEHTQRENKIVFAHRFLPRKNGLLFAKVAAKFLDLRGDWRVVMLGRGREGDLIQNVLSSKISSGSAFVGYKSPIFDEIRSSKIFVSVISPNNYPSQSVFESLAYGNALLLSNTGTSVDRFLKENGRSCELNEESMLEALLELTSDNSQLAEMSGKSRELVEKRYSKDIYLNHIVSMYG